MVLSRLNYTFAKKINRTRYNLVLGPVAGTVLSCRIIVPLWLTPLNFESNIFGLTKCSNAKLAERFKKIVWIIGIFQATFCIRNLRKNYRNNQFLFITISTLRKVSSVFVLKCKDKFGLPVYRDVTTEATVTTAVTSKFSDTLTLFQRWGADSTPHRRDRTKQFLMNTSLRYKSDLS